MYSVQNYGIIPLIRKRVKTFIQKDHDGTLRGRRGNVFFKAATDSDVGSIDPRGGVPISPDDDQFPKPLSSSRAKAIASDASVPNSASSAATQSRLIHSQTVSFSASNTTTTLGSIDKERDIEKGERRNGEKEEKVEREKEKAGGRERESKGESDDPSGYLLRDTLSDMEDDAENKDVVKGWNERYQIIREAIQDLADAEDKEADAESSVFYRILRFERDLYSLSQDFLYTAKTYGKIISSSLSF